MKCELCQVEMQLLSSQTYHYEKTLSGLDNVYLENITVERCLVCNDISPILHRIKELHKSIARAIVMQPVPLNGADIRFLRKERKLKAKEFAVLLRIDVATLSRWENDEQTLSPQSDALVRAIYACLLMETEHQLLPDSITPKIAAVSSKREKDFAISVNTANLSVYSYKQSSMSFTSDKKVSSKGKQVA